jgi:hypothetical protein
LGEVGGDDEVAVGVDLALLMEIPLPVSPPLVSDCRDRFEQFFGGEGVVRVLLH